MNPPASIGRVDLVLDEAFSQGDCAWTVRVVVKAAFEALTAERDALREAGSRLIAAFDKAKSTTNIGRIIVAQSDVELRKEGNDALEALRSALSPKDMGEAQDTFDDRAADYIQHGLREEDLP